MTIEELETMTKERLYCLSKEYCCSLSEIKEDYWGYLNIRYYGKNNKLALTLYTPFSYMSEWYEKALLIQ